MPETELALETFISNGYARTLDPQARNFLVESAPQIEEWSRTDAVPNQKVEWKNGRKRTVWNLKVAAGITARGNT